MRARTVAVIVALALVAAGCDWLQWAGSQSHRGSGAEPDLTPAALASLEATRMVDAAPSSPAVTTAGLVLVHEDGRLLALDQKSYAIVWSASLPAGSTAGSAPAIHASGANRTVFLTVAESSGTVLLGFDVDGVRNCNPALFTCDPVFRATLGSAPGSATPPLVDGGRVFAAGNSVLAAFDANGQTNCTSSLGTANCAPLWSAATGFAAPGIGPTSEQGNLFGAVDTGSGYGIRSYDPATGAPRWTGAVGATAPSASPSIGLDRRVYVPAGPTIEAFAGNGCGTATCAPEITLTKGAGAPAGAFGGTTSFDGNRVLATNTNGHLYGWPAGGCGGASCAADLDVAVNTPSGGSSDYSQSPILTNGLAFLLTRQVVDGADHTVLVALDRASGTQRSRWDLGTAGFGPGLANASMALGVIYAPVADGLFAVHPPAVQPLASLATSPLALSPAFSSSTFDYVVRCTAATNSVTLSMTAVAGGTVRLVAPTTTSPSASQSPTVQLAENQAAVVEATSAGKSARYWIRCLPRDFPALTTTLHPEAGTATPGWYVIGNNLIPSGASSYAMILDPNGTPVWYRRVVPAATNATPIARDTIAWMPDQIFFGFVVNDASRFDLRSLATGAVQALRTVGMPTDLHELYRRPNGNHVLLSYPLKRGVDLTGLSAQPTPGPNSTIADCVVQEIDPQGAVVWQWVGSDHLDPVTEPTTAPGITINNETVYDVYHCNSVDVRPNGDALVSARHLNAVFEIRRSDGEIVWKMGGKPVNRDGAAIIEIEDDPEGSIVQQHDARYLPGGRIGIFDNQSPQTALPARGIEYQLDLGAGTARPTFSYPQPEGLAGCCMGSFRSYPDGHRLIGWGFVVGNGRTLTELNAAGQSVFEVHLPGGHASYRAFKVPPPFFNADLLRATAGQ